MKSFVIFAALWWADFVGAFLEEVERVYYLYISPRESLGCHGTSWHLQSIHDNKESKSSNPVAVFASR